MTVSRLAGTEVEAVCGSVKTLYAIWKQGELFVRSQDRLSGYFIITVVISFSYRTDL